MQKFLTLVLVGGVGLGIGYVGSNTGGITYDVQETLIRVEHNVTVQTPIMTPTG